MKLTFYLFSLNAFCTKYPPMGTENFDSIIMVAELNMVASLTSVRRNKIASIFMLLYLLCFSFILYYLHHPFWCMNHKCLLFLCLRSRSPFSSTKIGIQQTHSAVLTLIFICECTITTNLPYIKEFVLEVLFGLRWTDSIFLSGPV